jgi:hypothetical protein
MYSLTHAFAVVLAFPVVYSIVCLLRKDQHRGNWLLLVIGLAALAGAKASFVPMLVAAVAVVAAVKLMTERRLDRTSVGLGLAVLAALSFAQIVLFGAGSSGIAFGPGQAFSQLYFLRAVFPFAIAASAWGLTLLLSGPRLRQIGPRVLLALGVGMVLAQVVESLTPNRPRSSQGVAAVSFQVMWPWLVVLLVAGLAVLVRWLVFDSNLDWPPGELDGVAERRYSVGAVAVYALTAPTKDTATPGGPRSSSSPR